MVTQPLLLKFVPCYWDVKPAFHLLRKLYSIYTWKQDLSSLETKKALLDYLQKPRWGGGFPGGSEVKASASNAGDPGSIPGSEPTPVFMPGKSHGPRSLVGYSPWGRKESDTTERLLLTSSSFVTYCLMKFKVRERHESDNLEGRAVL